jgi:hypothetical protein
MVNNNTLEELKEAYKNYKKGIYTFGKYGTGEQIERAFVEGKIFVMKGTKAILSLFIIIPIVYAIFMPIVLSYSGESYFENMLIFVSVAIPIIGSLIVLPICIPPIRHLVVIGPSGFYYRRVFKNGCFHWNDVTLAQASIHTTRGGYRRPPVTLGRVEIIFPGIERVEKRRLRFDSGVYRKKEFPSGRDVKRLMFIRLFKIYYELGKRQRIPKFAETKEIMEPEKRRKAEQIIYNFLMKNKGKAFTTDSLHKRCLELQQLGLEIDDIEVISKQLNFLGKIGQEVKENEIFYYIR